MIFPSVWLRHLLQIVWCACYRYDIFWVFCIQWGAEFWELTANPIITPLKILIMHALICANQITSVPLPCASDANWLAPSFWGSKIGHLIESHRRHKVGAPIRFGLHLCFWGLKTDKSFSAVISKGAYVFTGMLWVWHLNNYPNIPNTIVVLTHSKPYSLCRDM